MARNEKTQTTAVMIGVHVLDTLVRPVSGIPEGQGGALVEQIAISAAGTAGGSALVMSKLGARVQSCGVVGSDTIGDLLKSLLRNGGVDVTHLHTVQEVQTSASVLPIRADGSRPALHVVGANQFLAQHIPWDVLDKADIVHLGGPEFYGGELAAEMLSRARQKGAITSADSLAPGTPDALSYFQDALPHIDYFLPNDEQVLGWTGARTLAEGCERLVQLGAGCVVATAGAEPTVISAARGTSTVPAFAVDVLDTSGCGDAFSAGFMRGISLAMDPIDAARLGNGTAAQVAQGLGSAFGEYDLQSVLRFITEDQNSTSARAES
ncbi:carbohydrate kinase family protein [Peribacillus butanolivorans]|uniref:carbohydrate kinase family protein n=1 Tax=Peribacillus butanolivorans TaxID=421767 RepID=UPI00365F88E6